MSKKLTELQAYNAMFHFLKAYYERTNSDDVGSLLGDLQMMSDNRTADPAAWSDWIKSVEATLAQIDKCP